MATAAHETIPARRGPDHWSLVGGAAAPFTVLSGECALTRDVIIESTPAHELDGIAVELDVRDWLSEW